MAEAKKLVIFGDSIAKGVMFQDGRYHLCRGHDFDALAQQGVEVRNYAKMGACTDTGLAIAKKRLESCRDAQVLLFFGGKKIPELMKGLGKGVRSFKDGMNETEKEIKDITNSVDETVEDKK